MRSSIVPVALIAGACSAPQLQITPRVIQLDVEGEFGASTTGLTISNSLEELGIAEESTDFAPRADFRAGGLQITADYIDAAYEGTGTVVVPIEFNGEVFEVGSEVNTMIDLKLARGAATFDFIPSQLVDIGVGVGVGYVDALASVEDPLSGESARTEQDVPFPFVAARVGADLGPISAEVLAGYLEVDVDDVQANYLDLDGMVRWTFLGGDEHFGGALVAGYRYIDLQLAYTEDGDDVEIEAELTGPYLGLSLVF